MSLLLRLRQALAGLLLALHSRLAPWLSRLRRPSRRELLLGLAALPALLLVYSLILIPFTPGIRDIRKAKLEQPARVLSADGKELAVFKWANREWVGLERISPQVKAALIATEDHRFYEHHGIDFYRLAGAALRTFSGDKQGGSTLTQQLARNLFPDEIGRAPTLTRKLKEAITAFKIEAVYSKDEILETYLNTVPFLYNAWGIEMAARTYFDKPARSLDVLEAATLVGMLKGNSYYNPVLNPERAVARRNTVLAQMVKRGRLDAARLPALEKKPLRIDFERQLEAPGPAPHFAQQIRKALIAWADSHDYNIYADGLVVRTTLDSRLQAQATQAVQRRGRQLQALADQAWAGRKGWVGSPELVEAFVRESKAYRAALARGQTAEETLARLLADKPFLDALRQEQTRVQVGFLALDPRDGQVRAWVGSRDFQTDPFDHVAQARRQPGSTFKPFVYGAAFDKGMQPGDTLIDREVEIPLPDDEVWRPTDESPPSGKPVSLRDGLVYSRNRITAQLMDEVGPARVARLAKKMGVRQSPLEEVPSLALGTSPVTLKEMSKFCKSHISDLESVVGEQLGEALIRHELTAQPLPSDNGDATVSSYGEVMDIAFNMVGAEQVGEDVLVIPFECIVDDCLLDFFVYKSDWYALDDELSSRMSVADSDWNSHYMMLQTQTALNVAARLLVEISVAETAAGGKRVLAIGNVDIEIDEVNLAHPERYTPNPPKRKRLLASASSAHASKEVRLPTGQIVHRRIPTKGP